MACVSYASLRSPRQKQNTRNSTRMIIGCLLPLTAPTDGGSGERGDRRLRRSGSLGHAEPNGPVLPAGDRRCRLSEVRAGACDGQAVTRVSYPTLSTPSQGGLVQTKATKHAPEAGQDQADPARQRGMRGRRSVGYGRCSTQTLDTKLVAGCGSLSQTDVSWPRVARLRRLCTCEIGGTSAAKRR